MKIALKELREQEFMNVEKTYYDIASILRDIGEIRFYKVFGVTYLAYLAGNEKINTAKGLSDYIQNSLPFEQFLFLKECIGDLWNIAIEISNSYSVSTLLATVLWMQPSNGRADGECETPESIVCLATEILDAQNEKIADFCCGVGNFLLNAAEKDEALSYYGIELNTQSKQIAEIRLNLLSDKATIDQGTVFDIVDDRKFDKIFCDYPWHSPKDSMWISKEIMQKFNDIIPEVQKVQKSDWLFILNAVLHLSENGRAVVVTTNGTTWNGGIDKIIREKFVKMGYLEAVIAMPANMYSTTGIQTSMLVLSKDNKRVRMIDANSLASAGRRKNYLSDEAIEQIACMLKKDSDLSKSVTFDEIEKEDYAINPSRYLQVEAEVENGVPFEYVIRNIKSIEHKLDKYCIKNNSLVISKNGTPIKIAVASVPSGQKILGNGNLYVIELDETKVNPYFVKAYLESENGTIALSRIMVGAVMPNIPVERLKKVIIPCPDMEKQNMMAEKYLAKMDEVKVLRYRLAKAIAELKGIYEEV